MIGKSYIVLIAGLGLRALLMGALVIILARTLGDSAYGIFAASTSLAGFIAMFCGLGAGPLHVRDVSQGRLDNSVSLDRLARIIGYTSVPLLVISVLAAYMLIPAKIPFQDVAMLTIGEFCTVTASDTGLRIMQAKERYWGMVAATCTLPAIRLAAAIGFAISGSLSLHYWSLISISTGITGLGLILVSSVNLRAKHSGHRHISAKDMLGGVGFALSWASSRVHGDADKVLLARLASPATAGQYSIAYRLTDVLTLPIVAGVEGMLPKLFKQGKEGIGVALYKARLALLVGLLAAGTLSAVDYCVAPLLVWLLGPVYQHSVGMARALALVPLSMAMWTMLKTLAATSGHHQAMGAVELVGAAFNILVTTALVWAWSWKGAVIATYATHGFMVTILVIYLWITQAKAEA